MTRMIKVMVASCLLLAITPSLAKAQSKNMRVKQTSIAHEPLPVQAGIKGALGLSFYAFSVGGYGSYNVTDFLGLGGEINYIKDWHILQYSDFDFAWIRTNYVPVSFLAKIFTPKYPNFRFLGGIRVGYLISAECIMGLRDMYDYTSFSNKKKKDIDLSEDTFNRWTCEMVVGCEWERDFGLFYGLEYSKGFIAITNNQEYRLNSGLRLTLGYNFVKFFE